MVFRRRERRTTAAWAREMVYPRGGFRRATQYVMHRMRRLPDDPRRVARGFAAGVFISFTPFFGLHFIGAALIAWAMRGNILAALLGTFVGNPVTTPIIAITSVGLGHWMLGGGRDFDLTEIGAAFGDAGTELWDNFRALFTAETVHWNEMGSFMHEVYIPYLIGGIVPGLIVSALFYALCVPLVRAYQTIRADKAEERRLTRTRPRD